MQVSLYPLHEIRDRFASHDAYLFIVRSKPRYYAKRKEKGIQKALRRDRRDRKDKKNRRDRRDRINRRDRGDRKDTLFLFFFFFIL